jgi:hypothetical protein
VGIVAPQTVVAVALMLVLTHFAFGYPLPFDTANPTAFVTDLSLFVGYIYLSRTLVRLPIAFVISIRGARESHQRHGMNWRDSLFDGFYRGFLDRRRWAVGQLARLDRLALLLMVMGSLTPGLGLFLRTLGGLIGLALMLVVYLMTGTFSFLLDDSRSGEGRLPFLNIRRGG